MCWEDSNSRIVVSSQSSVSATSAACPRTARIFTFIATDQVRSQTSLSVRCSACPTASPRASSNWPLSKSGMSLLLVACATHLAKPRG